jgi:gamma-butyrobetaine dioxygenase
VIDELRTRGYAVIPSMAGEDPWALVEALIGTRPMMVERQPIRPIAGARSFAGSSVFTPFHTDSQDFLGAPPGLQVMVCRRAAASGGETRLVDGWALLDQIERGDPALYDALLTVPRLHRFYFGDVTRPTISELRGHVAWTHSPIPSSDPIGVALARALDRAPVIELAIRTGETLVVDNHRMLHGRTAFDGADRDFVRLLAWFVQPLAPHPRYCAARAGNDLGRLAVVLEMLTGVAPARLAAREDVPEAELYAWRNRALAAALAALDAKK